MSNGVNRDKSALARVTTGVDRLDEVLGGGIPRGSIVFVTGLPGAGKTILCEQALFANAGRDDSVLYLTTLSEPAAKVLRFTQGFGFFRMDLVGSHVHYADLGDALHESGPAGALSELRRLIAEFRPSFLVVDSFKVFREYFNAVKDFRAFTAQLTVFLATWEVTALLVGEYTADQIAIEPEFAIADGILHLYGTEEELRQKRYLNLMKMRGADAFLGRHSYEIGPEGITLYPRMAPRVSGEYRVTNTRIGSAIAGLTDMMHGGIRSASVALISGAAGSGKTLTALSFAVEAARLGLKALYVTFEESPQQLVQNCQGMGWDIEAMTRDGSLTFRHLSPAELDLDRNGLAIQDETDALDAQLVVIDSISAFEVGIPGGRDTFLNYIWGMSDHFKRQGRTLVLLSESFDSPGGTWERRTSYLADAVINLRLVEEGGQVRRCVNVLKIRGSSHDVSIRELRIDRQGMRVVDG